MEDPALADRARLQAQVAELAQEIARQVGQETSTELSAQLARIRARLEPDPGPSLDAAHAALQAAPGAPEPSGRRGRGALAAQVAQLSAEVAAHRSALEVVLAALADSFRQGTHHHGDLEGELDALHERFAAADRNGAWSATDLDVATRLEALERSHRQSELRPWFSSERFSAAFRGSQEALDARYADLADLVAARGGPVLDLGCGSGDMLALLAARGVDARGVDSDAESVDRARARGLDVVRGDALEVLASAAPGAFGCLLVIQVVEHLPAQQLVELVALAADKLRPGGLLLAETINPASLYVYGHALYLDPTHTTPVHPAYMSFLCQEAGFAEVDVQYRSHPPKEEALQPIEGSDPLVDGVNGTITRLNEILFGPQDYAVLATR